MGRFKAPEDTFMEIALERVMEDWSSSQGYAESSEDRMLFQTHDPPLFPLEHFFSQNEVDRKNFTVILILKTDKLIAHSSPRDDAYRT